MMFRKKKAEKEKSDEELRMDNIAIKMANMMAKEPLEKEWYIERVRMESRRIDMAEVEKQINKNIKYRIKAFIQKICCSCGSEAAFEWCCIACGKPVLNHTFRGNE